MTDLMNDERKKYARPNDRWQCSLDENQPCGGVGIHLPKEGVCVPRPSLRLHRGIFTFSCTAMVIGLLIACWNSPQRNEFLVPGPLSGSHAQILVAKGTDRCAACHGAGDKTLASWIRDAVSLGNHIPVSQSQLCMDCHDQSLVSEFAMHAHNLGSEQLATLTGNTVSTNSSLGLPDPRNGSGQLACATCHREHHGADFNLTALTDNQCQTCHVNHFHSFERDHPEFTKWPFAERTGIAFDHVSHGVKHFPEKNEKFNCQQCHVDDADGNVKLVDSFEVTCSQCHQQDITGDQNPGWTLFQLPMLDTTALADAGYSIGLWPDNCQGDFDGQLPPPMKLMLMSDDRTAAILNRHGKHFDFSDLDSTDPDDLSDAAILAWSIKELLYGLTVNGNQEIRERLESTLETNFDTDPQSLHGITHGLHEAVFAQAQQSWIPRLLSEMTAREKELNGNHRVPPNQIFARPTANQDEETLVDNPLAGLFQKQPRTKEPNEPQVTEVPGTPRVPETQTPKIVALPRPKIEHDNTRVRNTHLPSEEELKVRPFQGSTQELAINPLAHLKAGKKIPKAPPADQMSTITEEAVQNAITKIVSRSVGGWYRDDGAFKISYRVSNHVDPLLLSWTDLVMEHKSNPAIVKSTMFESLDSPNAAGQCRSCHTADQKEDSSLAVNWSPKYRDVSIRGFTRFSHRPHDIQTSLQDCTSCHQLDRTQSNCEQFAGFDSTAFNSNFAAVSKIQCASCHRADGAPSGCVDCHNYHVGSQVSGKK